MNNETGVIRKVVAAPRMVPAMLMSLALLGGCVTSGKEGLRQTSTETQRAAELNKQLGTAYLRQGNLPLAKEKLERAEQYNPRDAELHSVLAVLYERLGLPAEVDKHYRTAIRLAPKDPGISNNYAIYLCKNGRTKDGVDRFLESAGNPLYRTPEVAYTNAGVCLRKDRRLDEAQQAFARALQIRPNYAEAVFQAADLALERGEPARGREQVDKYLASYDATADLLLVGVQLTRALGDRVAEERFTRRLRVEFPDSQQLRSVNESRRNPG